MDDAVVCRCWYCLNCQGGDCGCYYQVINSKIGCFLVYRWYHHYHHHHHSRDDSNDGEDDDDDGIVVVVVSMNLTDHSSWCRAFRHLDFASVAVAVVASAAVVVVCVLISCVCHRRRIRCSCYCAFLVLAWHP